MCPHAHMHRLPVGFRVPRVLLTVIPIGIEFSFIDCVAPLNSFSLLQSRALDFHSVPTEIDPRNVWMDTKERKHGDVPRFILRWRHTHLGSPHPSGCNFRFHSSSLLSVEPCFTVSVRSHLEAAVRHISVVVNIFFKKGGNFYSALPPAPVGPRDIARYLAFSLVLAPEGTHGTWFPFDPQ